MGNPRLSTELPAQTYRPRARLRPLSFALYCRYVAAVEASIVSPAFLTRDTLHPHIAERAINPAPERIISPCAAIARPVNPP